MTYLKKLFNNPNDYLFTGVILVVYAHIWWIATTLCFVNYFHATRFDEALANLIGFIIDWIGWLYILLDLWQKIASDELKEYFK